MSENKRCPQCQAEIPADVPEGVCPRCVFGVGLDSIEPGATNSFSLDQPTKGFQAPSCEELKAHFPQLEILAPVGAGGMGAVYRARQITLDRMVALKVLPKHPANDARFEERFQREAKALARLTHPNIVMIFDFGNAGGFPYFVMEYVDGVNLREALRNESLAPSEALSVVGQICEALQFAHDEGVVHRDIKPENVLLDRKGRVKIADFGLAKLVRESVVESHLTGTQQVMGTVHYMAPEQMEKPHSVDHRADIYSLGVVFYELLTGELPIGRFAPPSSRGKSTAELDEVVLRTLEKEPERRYQHASELQSAVESASSPNHASAKLPPTGLAKSPVVAFKQESDMGWPNANGLLQCDGTSLLLEAQIRELLSSFTRPTCTSNSIPLEAISSIEFKPSVFSGGKLIVQSSSLVEAGKFPISSAGKAVLAIASSDREDAQLLCSMIQRRISGVPWNTAVANARQDFSDSGFVESGTRLSEANVKKRLYGPRVGMLMVGLFNLIGATLLLLALILPSLVSDGNFTGKEVGLNAPFSQMTDALKEADSRTLSGAAQLPLYLLALLSIAAGVLQLTAAYDLKRLSSWGIVLTGGIVCLVPLHLGWVLGLTVGLWTIITICTHGIRTAFLSDHSIVMTGERNEAKAVMPRAEAGRDTDNTEQASFGQPNQALNGVIFLASIFFLSAVVIGFIGVSLLKSDRSNKPPQEMREFEQPDGELDGGQPSTENGQPAAENENENASSNQ